MFSVPVAVSKSARLNTYILSKRKDYNLRKGSIFFSKQAATQDEKTKMGANL